MKFALFEVAANLKKNFKYAGDELEAQNQIVTWHFGAVFSSRNRKLDGKHF